MTQFNVEKIENGFVVNYWEGTWKKRYFETRDEVITFLKQLIEKGFD